MTFPLLSTYSDYAGFERLISLRQALEASQDDPFRIDMTWCTWLDAQMAALLGAAFYPSQVAGRQIELFGLGGQVEKTLQRNGFLTNFGFNRSRIPDMYGTTIEYQRFDVDQEKQFCDYVNQSFETKKVPFAGKRLRADVLKSLTEIFGNAAIHSKTPSGVFSCGQSYPRKRRLDFLLVDVGRGIRDNLFRELGISLSGAAAIEWAFGEGNTTRRGAVPGGLGLKLLKKFLIETNGKLQVASNEGYWEMTRDGVVTATLPIAFAGTAVNIEFSTGESEDPGASVTESEESPLL